jgi:hypothetical protein
VQFWSPLSRELSPQDLSSRGSHFLLAVARLRPRPRVAQARAELSGIQAGIKRANPEALTGTQADVYPLSDQFIGTKFRTSLYVLWGAVIACC